MFRRGKQARRYNKFARSIGSVRARAHAGADAVAAAFQAAREPWLPARRILRSLRPGERFSLGGWKPPLPAGRDARRYDGYGFKFCPSRARKIHQIFSWQTLALGVQTECSLKRMDVVHPSSQSNVREPGENPGRLRHCNGYKFQCHRKREGGMRLEAEVRIPVWLCSSRSLV